MPEPGDEYEGTGRSYELAVEDAAGNAKARGVPLGSTLEVLSATVVLSDNSHISDYIVKLRQSG